MAGPDHRRRTRFVLSHFQIAPILQARSAGQATALSSTDLGITASEVCLNADGVTFPGGEHLRWESVAEIDAHENACYLVEDDTPHMIRAFSAQTGRSYSLMPTAAAPTMLVSGTPMHRIKDTDPCQDTLAKIKAVAPVRGQVLDTATGLGYTAIEAAKSADHVITVELDPVAQEIARLNPWSQGLFDNTEIEQIIGDSYNVIQRLADEMFDCIIHDPPTFSLAGDLYSGAFYREARRVLKRRGRMFHYIGNPESKSGAGVTRGVVRRLREAGFQKVVLKRQAFGVVAYNSGY